MSSYHTMPDEHTRRRAEYDLDLAVRGILFSAVGTAGQRCTTLRRLIVHRSIKDEVVARVKAAYGKVRIGDPRKDNLVGPLIDKQSFDAMQGALAKARDEGGQVFGGERQLLVTFGELRQRIHCQAELDTTELVWTEER